MTENLDLNEPGFEQERHPGDSKNCYECIWQETSELQPLTRWKESAPVLNLCEK